MNELELHNLLFTPVDARGMKVKRCNKLKLMGPVPPEGIPVN